MSDLIRRQDATSIPVLPKEHREYQTNNLDDAYELGWYDCQKYIGQLPSVQKTGKWIAKPIWQGAEIYFYTCSECDYRSWDKEKYCAVCGAIMVGEEDE